jgi:hypothetical protein
MDNKKITLHVIYNGITREIKANDEEAGSALLAAAIHAFAITQGPHLLSLFRQDGTKVDETLSVEQSHLVTGESLLLRPDAVKGGA